LDETVEKYATPDKDHKVSVKDMDAVTKKLDLDDAEKNSDEKGADGDD